MIDWIIYFILSMTMLILGFCIGFFQSRGDDYDTIYRNGYNDGYDAGFEDCIKNKKIE